MMSGLLWFIFIVSALLLSLVVLIQEGKGGGLGEAFGGMAAETFGVKAQGVNRVTAILAAVFVLTAILINRCSMEGQGSGLFGDGPPAEETSGDAPGSDGAGGAGGTGGAAPAEGG